MLDNDENVDDDLVPANGHFLVSHDALEKVQNGRWLTIDGEFFEVTGWKEHDDDEPEFIQLTIHKIGGTPDDKTGFIGGFFRKGEKFKAPDPPEPPFSVE